MADCRERIMSEEYGDYIVEFDGRGENAIEQYRDYCPQIIGDRYFVVNENLENIAGFEQRDYPYTAIPKIVRLNGFYFRFCNGCSKTAKSDRF